MANISDVIEQFILSTFGDDKLLQLSRNDLATFFSCAPSQINYVLSTRFTPEKGYIVESKRGGGGCIKLIRVNVDKESTIRILYNYIVKENELEFNKLTHMLSRLVQEQIITEGEGEVLKASMSDKALAFPVNIAPRIRAQMFKEVLLTLSKRS